VSVLVSLVVRSFLYELKAGPAGGRLGRPSSRRQHPRGGRHPASPGADYPWAKDHHPEPIMKPLC
jgi:hypothetical protein